MKIGHLPRAILIAGIALTSTRALAQTRLLGIDSTAAGNNLVEFDTATGVPTMLGPVTGITGAIGGLTFDPVSGVTYLSSTSNDELYTFDVATRVATSVGPYNVGSAIVMSGIEYVPAMGKLYGFSSNSSVGADLFEIDAATGQATAIGITGVTGINGGGIFYANGAMYLAHTGPDSLYVVDLTTAATTLVGSFGGGTNIGSGVAYDPTLGAFAEDNLLDRLNTLDLSTGLATPFAAHGAMNIISLVFVGPSAIGTPYCAASPNSTGTTGALRASGSVVALDNDVTLQASSLPASAFGFFLTSQTQGFSANPGGSAGNLCLAGSIGRYVGAGQILNTGATGEMALLLDLTSTPTPTGLVSVQAGETWNFQAWHRDVAAGSATSNFTNGLEVQFQ